MVTGYKSGAGDQSLPQRGARALGVTLAAAVLVFWTWNLVTPGMAGGGTAAGNADRAELEAGHENDDD